MVDIKNPVGLPKPEEVEENKEEIARLLEDAGAVPQDPDTTRVILDNVLNPNNVDALTNLTLYEIYAVSKLNGMNKLSKNPLIGSYVKNFLNMKRSQYNEKSEPTSVLAGVFQIATRLMPR